jgi:hypothetical protein
MSTRARRVERFLGSPSALLIVFVSFCHIFAGALIVLDERALGTTPFSFFRGVLPPRWHVIHGLVLITAAVLALLALRWRRHYVALIFFQQVLLVGSASACVMAVVNGHFADFEPRPRAFIAADQIWVIFACVTHAFALGTERNGENNDGTDRTP